MLRNISRERISNELCACQRILCFVFKLALHLNASFGSHLDWFKFHFLIRQIRVSRLAIVELQFRRSNSRRFGAIQFARNNRRSVCSFVCLTKQELRVAQTKSKPNRDLNLKILNASFARLLRAVRAWVAQRRAHSAKVACKNLNGRMLARVAVCDRESANNYSQFCRHDESGRKSQDCRFAFVDWSSKFANNSNSSFVGRKLRYFRPQDLARDTRTLAKSWLARQRICLANGHYYNVTGESHLFAAYVKKKFECARLGALHNFALICFVYCLSLFVCCALVWAVNQVCAFGVRS